MDYAKPWLPVDDQIDKLIARGVIVVDRAGTAKLLRTVGYYRLTGYLYPFRASERYIDVDARERTRILNRYVEGTSIEDAAQLLDFDRELRLLVLDGVERIEIALRTQVGTRSDESGLLLTKPPPRSSRHSPNHTPTQRQG